MVLDNDYSAGRVPRSTEATPRYEVPVEVTAAHEYNHVLQYAYDVLQDHWMYESTATWSEEKVFAGRRRLPPLHGHLGRQARAAAHDLARQPT